VEAGFNAAPLARFLCAHHGVHDVSQIEVWGRSTFAWDVCRESVIPIETKVAAAPANGGQTTGYIRPLSNPQPRAPFKHPVNGQPMMADLGRVYIYNVVCRSYCNTTDQPYAVRLNYYNEPMSELQETRQQDAIYAEAGLGSARGAFAMLLPTGAEGRDMSETPLIETQFAYQNGPFIRTMALLNEHNIMNGLVRIPHEVCVEARLPVWQGEDKAFMPSESMIASALQAMQATPEGAPALRARYVAAYRAEMMEKWQKRGKSTYFVAMPINHVLAWAFHSESYRASGEQRVEEFRFSPPPGTPGAERLGNPLLYYLVPETLLQHTLLCVKRNWLGKVDVRPLESVGFEFVPSAAAVGTAHAAPQGELTIRAHVSYFAAPTLMPATIAALAPALAPGMPSCFQWSREDMERDAAVRALRGGGSGSGADEGPMGRGQRK